MTDQELRDFVRVVAKEEAEAAVRRYDESFRPLYEETHQSVLGGGSG